MINNLFSQRRKPHRKGKQQQNRALKNKRKKNPKQQKQSKKLGILFLVQNLISIHCVFVGISISHTMLRNSSFGKLQNEI